MGVTRTVLECGALTATTATTIDQIPRLQLEAHRCGCRLELKDAGVELAALIRFCGLLEVLRGEVERQAAERKDLRGVGGKSPLAGASARERGGPEPPRDETPLRARPLICRGR